MYIPVLSVFHLTTQRCCSVDLDRQWAYDHIGCERISNSPQISLLIHFLHNLFPSFPFLINKQNTASQSPSKEHKNINFNFCYWKMEYKKYQKKIFKLVQRIEAYKKLSLKVILQQPGTTLPIKERKRKEIRTNIRQKH